MSDVSTPTRRVSAAVFGNEKTVEVVLALDSLMPATAQAVANSIGTNQNLAASVLKKLESASIISALPRTGSRSPVYYDATDTDTWKALVAACRALQYRATSLARRHGADASTAGFGTG